MLNVVKKSSFVFALISIFVLSSVAFAANIKSPDSYGEDKVQYGNDKSSNLNQVFARVIKFILGFIGALSVLIIIIGGIFYIISGGETSKTDTAKGYILYAVVGLVVALLGWVIVNTVVTGLNRTGGGGTTTVNPKVGTQPIAQ